MSRPVPQARIQAAQYAHLPLSTIGADWIIDAADALFARQLRKWWRQRVAAARLAAWVPGSRCSVRCASCQSG